MLLDETIIAAVTNLKEQGFKSVINSILMKKSQMMQETMHPHYSKVYEFSGMKRLTGYAPIVKDHDANKEIMQLISTLKL